MDIPNYKQLKKLAETCRKVGIKSFKSQSFEFTLTDEDPKDSLKKVQKVKQNFTSSTLSEPVEQDQLTENDLLFWSSTGMPEDSQKNE